MKCDEIVAAGRKRFIVVQASGRLPSSIPPGKKDNVYILVDNSRNVNRKTHGQRYTFVDDRGAWTTPSTSMPRTPYVADSAGTWRRVFFKYGKYCTEHNPSRKAYTYEELAPQPAGNEVIVVRHYYNKLTAAPNDYQRRISWLEGGTVALVEYTGVFPGHCPHGNMTKNQGVYRRTDPDTLNAIVFTALYPTISSSGQRFLFRRIKTLMLQDLTIIAASR
jgi:hypothetical protein